MAVFSKGYREQLERDRARYQARERKRQEEVAKAADREEKKLLKEIEEEDARGKIDPPPELSPSELKEREMVERLERLEGTQRLAQVPLDLHSIPPLPSFQQRQRTEALRELRRRRDSEKKQGYERELGIPDREKVWEDEQAQIFAAKNAALIAEDERHHAEVQAIVEREKTAQDAAKEACEQDVAAKIEKAKPEARELLGAK